MDTNHFFSFSRIAMVMKREIIENWKKNLYAFIGLYAAFALVVVGNMWGMSMNAENAFASPDIFFVRYCTNILGAFIFICLLGSLIYASGILDNMRNKEMRISFLMLPGNNVGEVCGTLPDGYAGIYNSCHCWNAFGRGYSLYSASFV